MLPLPALGLLLGLAACGGGNDEQTTTVSDDPAAQAEVATQRLEDAGYTVTDEPFDPEVEDPDPIAGYKVRGEGVTLSMLVYSDPTDAIEAAGQFDFVSASGKSAEQGNVDTVDSRLYYGTVAPPKVYPDDRFYEAVHTAEGS